MHYSKQNAYSPTRLYFPRSVFQPTRVALVAFMLLLFFFLHLNTRTFPTLKAGNDLFTGTTGSDVVAPGFRPLNESRIAITTFTTEQKSFTHLSLKNKAHYAKKQGYDLLVDYDQHNSRGMMWHKFDMVQRVINGSQHDWVWWMDFDTLITNTEIKLEDIIADALANATNPELVDWIFTPDCFELNAGSFLTRATPRTAAFVDAVIDYHTTHATEEHQLSEQDCMRDIMFRSDRFNDSFIMVPQATINAFPKEIKCYDKTRQKWQPGTFMLHFAGAWAHVTEVDEDQTGFLMRRYEKEIIW